MDFEKVCMMFTMQEPFYGILLSSALRVPTNQIDTMAVGMSGNVFKLYYNPEFVEKLSVNTLLAAIGHEMRHVAFCHFTIFNGTPEDEGERKRRNIACDLEVNSYIDKPLLYNDEFKALFPDQFGYKPELGSREYYRLIGPQDMDKIEFTSGGCGDGNDGSDGKNGKGYSRLSKGKVGRFLDDHSMWPSGLTETEKDMIEQAVEDIVVQAAEIVEKTCGSIPGEMKIRLDAIRNRKIKPAADWKRYVRRYLGKEFSELIRKSKKRESRRFPDAAGNRHRRKSHVLVAIDTSGSVGKKEYEEFMGQIKTLTRQCTFTIVECDTKINKVFEYTGKMPDTVFGGGGTSFYPPIEMYNENRRKYDAIIYFTDGYAPVPEITPRDTLWVISSAGNKDQRKEFMRNGASVVFIPPQPCQEK